MVNYLRNNIDAISNFPSDSTARIKAGWQGNLGRSDGYVVRPLEAMRTWYGYSSRFQQTVDTIQGVLSVVQNDFDKQAAKIQTKIDALAKEELNPLESFQPLKSILQDELNLLKGSKNIADAYVGHCSGIERRQVALDQLVMVNSVFEKNLREHIETYNSLIEQFDGLPRSIQEPKAKSEFTSEQIRTRLDAYLSKWCSNTNEACARDYMSNGLALYKDILDGKVTSPDEYKEGRDAAIRDLSWFLTGIALQKGQGHLQGSFALEDPSGCLNQFLLKTSGCGDRWSSHYIQRSPSAGAVYSVVMKSSAHKGIDINEDSLPGDKHHLLFGEIDAPHCENKKLLLIKLETYSPFVTSRYGYDMMMHCTIFGSHVLGRFFQEDFDDHELMAKEHTPAETLKAFEAFKGGLSDEERNVATGAMIERGWTNKSGKEGKVWGIAYMKAFVDQFEGNAEKAAAVAKFKASLPELDHLDRRTGKEVYLTQEDLQSFKEEAI